MSVRQALFALLAALAFIGCGTSTKDLPVRINYSTDTAFHEWKTFRFASVAPGSSASQYPRYEALIQNALLEELTSRGYTRIEDGTPDFRVAYEIVFRGDTSTQVAPEGGGADPMARSHSGQTPSGSLTVKMLDPMTSEVLWTGHLADFRITVVEPQKQFASAVWRVLVEFPPITG